MKKAGKNIINDEDINMTYLESLGKTLKGEMHDLRRDVDELKGNVKFFSKYGGFGNGGGGGGGGTNTSSGWYISASLDNGQYPFNSNVQSNEISLESTGEHTLHVKIARPNGGTFNVTYSWFNGSSTSTRSVVLDASNSWTLPDIAPLFLGGSKGVVTVTASDGVDSYTAQLPYLTSAFAFSLTLAKDDAQNTVITDSDVFTEDVTRDGLKAKLHYDVGIDADVKYKVTDINGVVWDEDKLDLTSSTVGDILMDVSKIKDFVTDDANAGSYTFSVQVTIAPRTGGTSSVKNYSVDFNLIPSSLYLKVVPASGKIYSSQLTTGYESYYTGSIQFGVIPYYGPNQSRTFHYDVTVDGTQQISDRDARERQSSDCLLSIQPIDGGAELDNNGTQQHVLAFTVRVGGISKTFTYYLYAREFNTNLNYYPINDDGLIVKPVVKNTWGKQVTNKNYSDGTKSDLDTLTSYLGSNPYYEMNINSDPVRIQCNAPSSPQDMLFSFGIMLSEINNEDDPLLSISVTDSSNTSDEKFVTVYPKKIIVSSSEKSQSGSFVTSYIPLTEYANYNPVNDGEFHVVSIYKRCIRVIDTSTSYFELTVYIDGYFEAAFSSWFNTRIPYDRITLYPENYYINLLELSYFNHNDKSASSDYLSDAGIVRYAYSYNANKKKIEIGDAQIEELQYFEKQKDSDGNIAGVVLNKDVDKLYDFVEVAADFPNNIAVRSKIPVLLFSHSDSTNPTAPFMDWLSKTTYSETETIVSQSIDLKYSEGGVKLRNVSNGANGQVAVGWDLDIEGSTTRKYRGKNFTLSVHDATGDESGREYLFSPNFLEIKDGDKDDPTLINEKSKTFLPEKEFILKADMVDSSHSNNTTIGEFVNDNTDKYENAKQPNSKYGKYIKNCLLGFPVMVFVSVTGLNGQTHTYYLGIYNFNLGRSSIYNLGYKDTNALAKAVCIPSGSTGLSEGFNTYYLPSEEKYVDGLMTAEVMNNSPYWDFSQYDETVLYKSKDDPGQMFGHITANSDITEAGKTEYLHDFVSSVARAGGYIFDSLGKYMSDETKGNLSQTCGYNAQKEGQTNPEVSNNQVPNYRIQYIRKTGGSSSDDIYEPKTDKFDKAQSKDLRDLIIRDEATGNPPHLDYKSSVEYYTVCMAFGLLDSVEKNLNIKTWGKPANGIKTWYMCFYDMDTCLGINNKGGDASYFAFSDYWQSTYEKVTDKTPGYTDESASLNGLMRPSVITIYRDFSPQSNSVAGFNGYDVPSSYLFAIPKYAKIFEKEISDSTDITYPSRLWAQWRKSDGPLSSAEAFIEKYIDKHMSNVTPLELTFDYRAKYFAKGSGYMFDTTSFPMFKGRRREYVREWLNGHFHILDAYFNMPASNDVIYHWDADGNWAPLTKSNEAVTLPKLTADDIDATNDDIYVIHSIFGDDARVSGDVNLNVKAIDLSPLFITRDQSTTKMLLQSKSTYYNIYQAMTGYNVFVFGGSSMWTYVQSINCFNGNFKVDSKLLENLYGDNGTINSWDVTLPSVKTISLTSTYNSANKSGYSGNLEFNDPSKPTPNLTSIDISNTGIKLLLADRGIQVLKAVGCHGASLDISNCSKLNDIQLSGEFSSINISNVPVSFSLKNTNIGTLDMSTSNHDLTFSIENDPTITTLTLNGYKKVTVKDCANLTTVKITDAEIISITRTGSIDTSLKDVTISNSKYKIQAIAIPQAQKLETISMVNMLDDNGSSNSTLLALDLSNTSVTKIKYTDNGKETSNDNYLDLSRFIGLKAVNLSNNSAVEYIQFANGGTAIPLNYNFQGCSALKRIYGHVLVNVNSCFYNLSAFSIHGDGRDTTWKGKSIFSTKQKTESGYDSERILMPYELLGLSSPKDLKDDMSQLFQSGMEVTNMDFTKGDYVFSGTKCTVFDIYYFFTNIGSTKTANGTFQYNKNYNYGHFSEQYATGNPNRYMFYNCENITSMTNPFYAFALENGTKANIRLYSPSHDANGNITADDGLFSPLVNCTNLDAFLWSYTGNDAAFYIDRFVFRRKEGSYKITNLNEFWFRYVVDDINKDKIYIDTMDLAMNYETILAKYGNIGNLFHDMRSLVNIDCLGNGCEFLNYDLTNKYTDSNVSLFPKTITSYNSVLNVSSAVGSIEFNTYTDNNENITEIRSSFRVDNSLHSKLSEIEDATFEFYEGTFRQYTKLVHFDAFVSTNDPRNVGSYSKGNFGGNGITKTYLGSEFPFNMFAEAVNLESFTGFFNGCHFTNQSTIEGNSGNPLKLPANMFDACPKLTNIEYAFYNLGLNYQLSSIPEYSNFSKCTNLEYVDYAFANPEGKTTELLNGPIPAKFFYHGTAGNVTKKIYGSDIREPAVDASGNTIEGKYIYPDTPDEVEVTYDQPIASIIEMNGVFQNCNCSPYVNTNPTIEDNPNYSPFKYTFSSGSKWSENTNIVKQSKTCAWEYDGVNVPAEQLNNMDDFEYLDEIPVEATENDYECDNVYKDTTGKTVPMFSYSNESYISSSWNFCAPPDLFRYCASNANVSKVFYHSGTEAYKNLSSGSYYGLQGRICPYLLRPVSKATNTSGMFHSCKGLSYYREKATSKVIFIPTTFFQYAPNIIDLSDMFSYLGFTANVNIDDVFRPLKSSINIADIFYRTFWVNSVLTGVFSSNNVSRTSGAFAVVKNTGSHSDDYPQGKIAFVNIFKDYSGNMYASNQNYSFTFSGYAKGNVIHEPKMTLPNNKTTYNYIYKDGDIPS